MNAQGAHHPLQENKHHEALASLSHFILLFSRK
jgi:hypothetical protein